jgi:hypothetical protein
VSATGRGAERRADDFYATPPEVTRAILPYLNVGPEADVLDPCAGDGAILAELQHRMRVPPRGIEIDQGRACSAHERVGNVVRHADALIVGWHRPDVVITNPPYSLAEAFIHRAHDQIAKGGTIAMLLRLNFLGSQKRAVLHRTRPADVYVLPKRPSFTGKGTDATEYAWFVWGPGRGNRWEIL